MVETRADRAAAVARHRSILLAAEIGAAFTAALGIAWFAADAIMSARLYGF